MLYWGLSSTYYVAELISANAVLRRAHKEEVGALLKKFETIAGYVAVKMKAELMMEFKKVRLTIGGRTKIQQPTKNSRLWRLKKVETSSRSLERVPSS
ncbi:hypothetical protein ACOSP7_022366 [Xanthoceras sorbifolium]